MRAKTGGATLLESTEPGARTFGRLGAGTGVTVLGTTADMTKVALGDGRFGFVKTTELEQGGTAAGNVPFEEVMRRFPPSIEVWTMTPGPDRSNSIKVSGPPPAASAIAAPNSSSAASRNATVPSPEREATIAAGVIARSIAVVTSSPRSRSCEPGARRSSAG